MSLSQEANVPHTTNKPTTRLSLSKETLKLLSQSDLRGIEGAYDPDPDTETITLSIHAPGCKTITVSNGPGC